MGRRKRKFLPRPLRRFRRAPFLWQSILVASVALLVLLLLLSPPGCSPKGRTDPLSLPVVDRAVRVRVLQTVDVAVVNAAQPPVYFTSSDPTPKILDLPPNINIPITLAPDGWRVGRTPIGPGILTLRPASEGSLKLADRAYRGQLRFVPFTPPRFDVVNDLDVDGYLKSVLPRELLANWHDEAYRAQAIASRTYALYEKHYPRETARHYDLNADVRSQVYGGLAAETPKSRAAVDATSGIVVGYGHSGDERLIKAYFSACCGGISQSNSDAFGETQMPALIEQNLGTLCSASPKFNWPPVVVPKDHLSDRMRKWGERMGHPIKDLAVIRSVEIASRNKFNRPVRFAVNDSRNMRYILLAEQLRWAVNTDAPDGQILLSSYVENIITESNQIRFAGGHGHGHGVGLCQYCTEARARAGIRHEDIVLYSYPGAKLVRAY